MDDVSLLPKLNQLMYSCVTIEINRDFYIMHVWGNKVEYIIIFLIYEELSKEKIKEKKENSYAGIYMCVMEVKYIHFYFKFMFRVWVVN